VQFSLRGWIMILIKGGSHTHTHTHTLCTVEKLLPFSGFLCYDFLLDVSWPRTGFRKLNLSFSQLFQVLSWDESRLVSFWWLLSVWRFLKPISFDLFVSWWCLDLILISLTNSINVSLISNVVLYSTTV
jgi:hypothetical protein